MSLDLGALAARVVMDTRPFDAAYAGVIRKMSALSDSMNRAAAGSKSLDRGMAGAAAGANRAATADDRLSAAAAKAAAAQERHAVALRQVSAVAGSSTVAQLRLLAATARVDELQRSGTATTRQLAAAQATAIAATNKLAASDDRLARAQQIVVAGAGKLGTALKSGVAVGAVAATAAIYESIKAAASFQTATTRIHTQADATVGQVARLSKGILAMSSAVATSPQVLADAAYHIASVGQKSLTTAQQLRVLRIAAEGAKLGNADLIDVTNALDAAIVSNMQGVKNYSQVMGVMNKTVGAGDMTMQNFADAFGPLGSTFKSFGITIQQAGAALAVFGDNNLRGTLAGNQFRQVITSLAYPLTFGRAQLEAWGIKAGNLAAQLRQGGLTKALDVLAGKLHAAGYTAKTMGPIIAEMFGKRGPQQGLSMLVNELDRYHSKLDTNVKGTNSLGASWKGFSKTFKYAADAAKTAAEVLGVELGNKLLPTATRVLRWLGTSGAAEARKLGRELAPLGHLIADVVWPALKKLGDQVIVGGIVSAFQSLARTVRNNADGLRLIGKVLSVSILATLGYLLPNIIKSIAAMFGIVIVVVGQVGKVFLHLKDFLTGPFVRAVGIMASLWLRATKDMLDVFLSVAGGVIHAAASMFGWVPGIGGKLKSAAAAFDSFRGSVDATLSAAAASAAHWGAVAAGNWNRGWNAGLANRSANAAEYAGAASGAKPRPGKYETTAQAARIAAQATGQAAGTAFTGGTADGITAGTPGVSSAATKMANAAVDAAKSVFDSAKSRLTADLGVRSQEASSVMSNQLAGLDLSNAVMNGRAGNISAFLRAVSIPVRRLRKDERLLRDAGLSPKLLQQIADTDPSTGLTIAQNILAGKSGSISHINQLVAQARAYAKATGNIVAHSLYDNRIARDRQDVHNSYLELKKLNANVAGLRQDLKGHPNQTGHAVAGALDHALSGAHHKAQSRTSR